MSTVVCYNVIAVCVFGTLVLQHVLEVWHRLCYGRHHLLPTKGKNFHHIYAILAKVSEEANNNASPEKPQAKICSASSAPARLSI